MHLASRLHTDNHRSQDEPHGVDMSVGQHMVFSAGMLAKRNSSIWPVTVMKQWRSVSCPSILAGAGSNLCHEPELT